MDKNDCFFLGHTVRLHGFKGEISIRLDVDNPKNYKKLESVFIEINGQLVPFFIKSIRIADKGYASIKLENVSNQSQAEELLGHELYLPLSMLPPLKGNKFYFHEVKGFKVIDSSHGEIGIIEQILEFPQQAIIQVLRYDKKEVLIPVTDEIIISVNRENNTMEVNLPDGLLDVYL